MSSSTKRRVLRLATNVSPRTEKIRDILKGMEEMRLDYSSGREELNRLANESMDAFRDYLYEQGDWVMVYPELNDSMVDDMDDLN